MYLRFRYFVDFSYREFLIYCSKCTILGDWSKDFVQYGVYDVYMTSVFAMSALFSLCFCPYEIVLFVAYFSVFAQNAWGKIRKIVLFVAFVVPTVKF